MILLCQKVGTQHVYKLIDKLVDFCIKFNKKQNLIELKIIFMIGLMFNNQQEVYFELTSTMSSN